MLYKDIEGNIIPEKDVWFHKFIDYEEENVVIMQKPDEGYLRQLRAIYCFNTVNRGQVWYDTLTDEQKQELKAWYNAWLDVTETKIIPEKPEWLK